MFYYLVEPAAPVVLLEPAKAKVLMAKVQARKKATIYGSVILYIRLFPLEHHVL